MKTGLLLASLAASMGTLAHAWTPRTTAAAASSSRRGFLDAAAKIVPLVLVAEPVFAEDEAAAAAAAAAPSPQAESPSTAATEVVAAEVAPPVVEEEAPPTASPSEENEFIATLKARSEANRDKNLAMSERGDKLSYQHFRSQYDKPSFVGVHSPNDDSVKMVLKEDFDSMLSSGKVKQTYESKVSKKTGEISDDYSRPIFVFVN